MRFLSARTHEVIQYLTGLALIAFPWLFGFHESSMTMQWSIATGILIIAVNLLTDTKFGVVPIIPMVANLGFDFAIGTFLACTPLSFRFHPNSWIPLMAVGVLEMTLAIIATMPDHVHHTEIIPTEPPLH